jgi:sulfopyruvate decarboxylase subunit beta
MFDIRTAIRAVVSTCGYISRDLFNIEDRPEHFYMVGSMGMAAPVALGVALGTPGRRVVVLDGDGSYAMNLGCLPMIAANRPELLHVVLDNGAHESTGGQRTAGIGDPVAMALAAGYAAAYSVASLDELAELDLTAAPTLLHLRCLPRDYPAGRRVDLTPQQLVARFGGRLRAPAPAPLRAPALRGTA